MFSNIFFGGNLCSLICYSYSQAAAQLLSAAMIIHAHSVPYNSASSVLVRPWFIVLVLAGAVERLCGVALGVAMERDWVVLVWFFNLGLIISRNSSKVGTFFRGVVIC